MRLNRATDYSILLGYRLRETDKAIQFKVHQVDGEDLDEPKNQWFPISRMKSQSYNTTPGSNDFDTITVESWLAEKLYE